VAAFAACAASRADAARECTITADANNWIENKRIFRIECTSLCHRDFFKNIQPVASRASPGLGGQCRNQEFCTFRATLIGKEFSSAEYRSKMHS
jgi:hypothetical protein